MKRLLLVSLLVVSSVITFAQTRTNIAHGSSLPTACALGDVYVKTSATEGMYRCTTAGNPGTWTLVVEGTGGGTVTTTGSPANGNLTKFSGASSITNADLTGDVTTSGTVATTIANDAVTNAKAANMAESTIKGRAAGAGTGDPTDLTATQATAILNAVVGDSGSGGTKGLVPAPSAGDAAAGKFLKADGTFAVPSGGGGGGGALVLLASQTASSSASLAFTTRNATGQSGAIFQSDFDSYVIEAVALVGDTNATTFDIHVSTNGGSTYETTNYVGENLWERMDSSSSAVVLSTTSVQLTNAYGTGVTRHSLSAIVKAWNPLGSANKHFSVDSVSPSSGTTSYWTAKGSAIWNSATTINAFRVKPSSGTFTSGAVYVYGICKASCASSTGNYSVNNGRLTTETAVPVSASDRTSQSTIYWTPFKGNRIGLYTASGWVERACSETSLALSGLTSGKNYDVFMYDNAGACALELSAAWTNDTTRADAITTQDGIYVKSGTTTRRLIGTIRTTGTTTTEDSAKKRFVWNVDNQKPRPTANPTETTDTWTYSTASWRQANNSATNQFEFVQGLAYEMISADVVASVGNSNASATSSVGIGLDSTTTLATNAVTGRAYPSSTQDHITASWTGYASIGYHYVAWLEASNGNSTTFNGDAGLPGVMQSGIVGIVIN